MVKELQEKGTKLFEELTILQNEFNAKKEQYLKIQGALEALQELK